ncbi:MAG TPA: PEP/pyruvate-binding domain-containing protein [Streptosporangiaceae bacterium]|nr:PEP/pyruvate-binding domain-containing protein [Streptosporangiaceae bacterium]
MTGGPGFARLVPLGGPAAATAAGAKAARLSAALRAGLPVLPGWVVPCAQARAATRAAAAAVRRGEVAAARRAALSCPLDPGLGSELAAAVTALGGRVVVRSSSPLEQDPCWSGAFSSIAEVGPAEAATAVRSCWAAAFAADPLARLASCGLAPEALELGVVIQPELIPDAGGTARVVAPARAGRGGDIEVEVEAVTGHPGPLLAGWAEGACARLPVPAAAAVGPAVPPRQRSRRAVGAALAGLIGPRLAWAAADLAARVHRLLGDDTIEWAAKDGEVWLLQSAAGLRRPEAAAAGPAAAAVPERIERLAARHWMPLLAAAVRARGHVLYGRPAAAGTAAGRLVACRPHQRAAASWRDAILLVDRPLPALAPLLFGARGLIARSGAAGSHLAEVARSLAVPMVTGCQVQAVIDGGTPGLPGACWLAAIDGTTGEVALLPG